MATVVLSYAGAALGSMIGGPLGGVIGRAAGGIAGNIIDQGLFGAKRRRIEGPRLQDLRVMASEEGAAIPVVWGRMRIAGQVIWATNILEVKETSTERESSKAAAGPSSKVTRYSYFASFAIGLCEGEIDGIGRVWADGREIDASGFTLRVYRGTETQAPDSLIVAVEGTGKAPAYRGLAYVVFEQLPLADFGNRIPQLSFEVLRRGNDTAERVRGMCLIPGSTEFGYDTRRVARKLGDGEVASENAHASTQRSDWSVSLDQLQETCRNLDAVSLVVAWFGTDLRCNHCQVRPGVDQSVKATKGDTWKVAGLSRGAAHEVSRVAGLPAFGGTPSDGGVKRAIADLKARGLKVVFYPFILMDVAAGNSLPDPYGGTGQAVYPWRGRITASIAPGRPGTPDKTATAAAQVASFTGSAAAGDFSISGGEVIYDGPAEWSFRRMILHYAKLCAAAGGVDAFLIGSELRGLTTLRSSASGYPFVSALVALAAEVKAILPGAKVSYAADWSEYFGHQPPDGTGDVHFHLDPLWASAHTDFIGIDNYMPLSDWRDGGGHLDAQAGVPSLHDLAALKANIAGGEGFDWYYASDADREAQLRSPVSDGAYGKPWVYRYKDLKGWWSNPHVNRPGGIESASSTAWVPQSKPIWFTEAGCPAIDKGTNQPNVFFDAKSSESAVPYFSSGDRDDLIQNRYVRAVQDYWAAAGGHNPPSTEYMGRMVDATRIFYWAWDARPFPQFPALTGVWSDGVNFSRGHWLNGRLGAVDLGELVEAVAARFGLESVGAGRIAAQVDGFVIDRPMSGREALESLLNVFAVDAVESGGALHFVPREQLRATVLADDALAEIKADAPLLQETRAQEADVPQALRLGYVEAGLDYRSGAVWQRNSSGASQRELILNLPAAVSQALAQARADVLLADAWQQRTTARFALTPRSLALEPGDVVRLRGQDWRIGSIVDGTARQVEAAAHDASVFRSFPAPGRVPVLTPEPHYAEPDVEMMDLATGERAAPWIAAQALPWPRHLALFRQRDDGSFDFSRLVSAPATMGRTRDALPAGLVDRLDHAHVFEVELSSGALSSVSLLQMLAGANRAAIGTAEDGFEIIQFLSAELTGPRTYRLSGLLRARGGSAAEMQDLRAAGQRFVLLNAAVVQPETTLAEAARPSQWRIGPQLYDHGHESYAEISLPPVLKALRPLAPVHLRGDRTAEGTALSWIRCTRNDGDGWELADVPLGEANEFYRVTILDGGTQKRSADVPAPYYLYGTSEMAADFGAVPASFTARVQQVSTTFGPGIAIERIIHV